METGMANIEKGCIILGEGLHYTSVGECKGPLVPMDLFKPESECGIGEMFLAVNPDDPDGDMIPMMKVDKQWLEDALKFWYDEH